MTMSTNPSRNILANLGYKMYGGHLPDKAPQIPAERLNDFLQRTNKCVKLNNVFDEYSFSGKYIHSKEPNVAITHLKNEFKVHNQNKKEGKPDDIITKKVLNSAKNCFIFTMCLPIAAIGPHYIPKLIKNPKAELSKIIQKNNLLFNLAVAPLLIYACGMLALQMMGGNLLGEARMLNNMKNK